jgi:hypothetical protein
MAPITTMIWNTSMANEFATIEQRKGYVMKKHGQCAAIIA